MGRLSRWLLVVVLLAFCMASVAGYVAWRRDGQYRTFVAMGDAARAEDDAFGAIEAFSGAIALRPGSMLAWMKRGEVHLRRGDLRSALRDLRRAVSLDPAALPSLELLGDTLVALERHSRAAEQYDAYLRIDDRDARVFYKLGLARLYDGHADSAVTALTRSLRLNEGAAETHYLLGLALSQQRRRTPAIRELERAVALAPAMIEGREALALRYHEAGRGLDEVRQLEAIAALDPGRPQHDIAVADAWAHSGRLELAIGTLSRARDRFPDNADLLTAAGRLWLGVYEQQQDPAALRKALRALTAASGQNTTSTVLTLLGRAQLYAGDAAAALRSLQLGTAMLPVDARALGDLATAAERAHRPAVARVALEQQAILVGDAIPARQRIDRAVRIANLCEKTGDRSRAATWLRRAVDIAPEPRIAARLARLEPGTRP